MLHESLIWNWEIMTKPSTMIYRWYTNFKTTDSSNSDKDRMQVCFELWASISLPLIFYTISKSIVRVKSPLGFFNLFLHSSFVPSQNLSSQRKSPSSQPPACFIADPVFTVEVPVNIWAWRHVFWRICIVSYPLIHSTQPSLSHPWNLQHQEWAAGLIGRYLKSDCESSFRLRTWMTFARMPSADWLPTGPLIEWTFL